MAYPQDALAEDEELLLHHHPHWKMLLLPALTFIAITAVAGFGLGLAESELDGTSRSVALIAIAVVWLIIVVWRCAAPLVSWKSTHFIVTDRRVLIRQGVINHSGIDIPMGRISNVQFRHALLDRMLGTGTLIIASNSDDPLEFDDIPHVQRVHSLLYQQVFDALSSSGRGDSRFESGEVSADDADGAARRGWKTGKRR